MDSSQTRFPYSASLMSGTTILMAEIVKYAWTSYHKSTTEILTELCNFSGQDNFEGIGWGIKKINT